MNACADFSTLDLRLVSGDDTFPLRKAVLRPWLTLEDARRLYDGAGEHFHVGALMDGAQGKKIVSTAAFMVETHPDYREPPFEAVQWRLRGMASDPALQGKGLGGRVLAFGVAEVARRLGASGVTAATLWCNGRTGAQRFYERHGFQPVGPVFETPGTGPHYVFWRKVVAAA